MTTRIHPQSFLSKSVEGICPWLPRLDYNSAFSSWSPTQVLTQFNFEISKVFLEYVVFQNIGWWVVGRGVNYLFDLSFCVALEEYLWKEGVCESPTQPSIFQHDVPKSSLLTALSFQRDCLLSPVILNPHTLSPQAFCLVYDSCKVVMEIQQIHPPLYWAQVTFHHQRTNGKDERLK